MNKKNTVLCIVETILVNIIIYFLFFIYQPDQDTYLQLNPHPLFLLSIAMGMRYGNYLGLVSAVISSLFYIKVFLYLNNDILLLFRYFENYKYILLFFWSALIFGAFKDNHLALVEKLSSEKKFLEDDYKKLKNNHFLTQKVQKELKKQIIGSEESILNLYEIASRLETLDSEEVYTETIGILLKYLKADSVSIYTYNENSGYLRLKIRTGDFDIDKQSLFINDSAGLNKVVYQKQVVRWKDVDEDNFPLMSAPLIKDDKVLAVVNIIHMDFDKLSEYAFQLFKLIIEWVNKALEQAIYVDGLKDSKYIEGTRLLRYEAFKERLKEEERRKNDFGMGYSLLKYKIKELSIDDIDDAIGRILRTVDIVGYDTGEKTLFILFPATPQDKLPLIEERIHSQLAKFTETFIKDELAEPVDRVW